MLTIRRLVAAITFVSLFAMATRVSVDSDTWWHLRAGAWTVEHRQVLMQDQFSSTNFGRPWQYPAWLSESAMYLIFERWGYAGLNLFTAAFVTIAFAFVWAACEGNNYLRALTVILAATASAVYWAARPHIISFAMAAGLLYILGLFRWRDVNRLWLLPPMMIVWANSHPGFAIGFLILGLTVAGETIKALAGTGHWRRVGWLVGIGAACGLAVMVTPYGPGLLLFPFKTVGIETLRDYIQEWQSPDFHMREAQVFIGLMLATLAAVGLSRRRLDPTDLLLLAGFIYLSLVARRNIALFSLVAAPVLTRHVQAVLEDLAGRRPSLAALFDSPARPARPLALAANWLILGAVVVAALVKVSIPLDPTLNERLIAQGMPVTAAEFIRNNHPSGPMFNSYNWGGYLAWALYPEYPVYVDGRTDLYDDAFLQEYLRVIAGRPGWEGLLAGRGIRLMLLESGSRLAALAARDPAWILTYSDPLATVFERRQ